MRVKLYFYGEMRDEFGLSFEMEANSPREAVTALMYQSQKYKDILKDNDWHVMLDGKEGIDISEDQLDMDLGKVREIHLIPKVEGSNNGVLNFIVGAVMVVIGVLNIWNAGAGMIAAGVGMMVGGIIQMTTKIPGAGDINRETDEKASFLFNSPTNSSSQGVAIPRGYGRMMIGSQVISAALYSYALDNEAVEEDPVDPTLPEWPGNKVPEGIIKKLEDRR